MMIYRIKGSMQSLSAEQSADCKSVTPSMRPLTNDKQYYHMPFNERKPSCYVTSFWHDHKRRMYNSNLMDRIFDKLREGQGSTDRRSVQIRPEISRIYGPATDMNVLGP